MRRKKTLEAVTVALSAALICVCSWIQVPSAVPFTLQAFAVFLSASILGMKKGTLAVGMYILLGAVGLPVFSGFQGGVGALFGATGGFIWGFLLSALVIGFSAEHFGRGFAATFTSSLAALLICYLTGTLWYMHIYGAGLKTAIAVCILPFILPDIIKIIFVAFSANRFYNIKEKIRQ